MLVEIRCDKFAKTHQTIKFLPGLNTVLGSSGGSNAIGKSTFLWIIDYAFGGDGYYKISDDIEDNVGPHTIYFTFEFNGERHYFYRNTDEPKYVCRTDKEYHLIDKLPLEDYQKFLFGEYNIGLQHITFPELVERFFRIYGRGNTLEKYPLLLKLRETDEKAVNFLLKLFGNYNIIEAIKQMEEELGIKDAYRPRQRQYADIEKIELNQKTIESLKKRLQTLIKSNEEAQLSALGFDTQTFERITAMQKEMMSSTRKRNRLLSQLNAIESNLDSSISETTSEFDSLVHFFPDADIKAFQEIENFHRKIREILGEEMAQEIERLRPLISHYDGEIKHLQRKIEESGLAKEMSERTLSQCISVSKSIDELEEETKELIRQRELQEARAKSEQQLENLVQQQVEKIEELQGDINLRMKIINDVVTEKQETAPILHISPYKEISFETPGNTSEGTAFKSLLIYDLSILELCPIPGLIHDSNILKRIEDKHLEHILNRYQESKKQVFIAFDKADSATQQAQVILDKTAILRLSDENVLYGHSWSKGKMPNHEQKE